MLICVNRSKIRPTAAHSTQLNTQPWFLPIDSNFKEQRLVRPEDKNLAVDDAVPAGLLRDQMRLRQRAPDLLRRKNATLIAPGPAPFSS
jgi:hypothetical protein